MCPPTTPALLPGLPAVAACLPCLPCLLGTLLAAGCRTGRLAMLPRLESHLVQTAQYAYLASCLPCICAVCARQRRKHAAPAVAPPEPDAVERAASHPASALIRAGPYRCSRCTLLHVRCPFHATSHWEIKIAISSSNNCSALSLLLKYQRPCLKRLPSHPSLHISLPSARLSPALATTACAALPPPAEPLHQQTELNRNMLILST